MSPGRYDRRMVELSLVEFPADDPERARRFWEGLLGVPFAEREDGEGRGWQTREGGVALGLHERGPGPGDRFSLPYFAVADVGGRSRASRRWAARLSTRASGGRSAGTPRPAPPGLPGARRLIFWMIRVLWWRSGSHPRARDRWFEPCSFSIAPLSGEEFRGSVLLCAIRSRTARERRSRPPRCDPQGSRKTARVAVNPCRKALPPTGPISPPQKKPARA
jgi:catechol 2,3-dioxygenase-like lactoylglutathione lyase family enzyme